MDHFQENIDSSNILNKLGLKEGSYILVTAHRSENVDSPENLTKIFDALKLISKEFQQEIIFPMHPRTQSKIEGINIPKNCKIIKPLGFYDFNKLLKNSFCILSDSGTAAEEGLYYKVPNVSLRMATERQETVESGGNIVSGMDAENILESIKTSTMMKWSARYELESDFSPSSVVVNTIRSQITNFF